MPTTAAGILLCRHRPDGPQVLLGHLGGPYFAAKDERGWTLPKGLVHPGEDLLAAAQREWREETGTEPPPGDYHALPPVKASDKTNHLFLVAGDADATTLVSNTCTIEWPPRSGRRLEIPEVDRFAWFTLDEAGVKLSAGLAPVIELARAVLAKAD